MTTPMDFLSGIGKRYLDSQPTVNNGEVINIASKDNIQTADILSYIRQVMLNSSRYIPLNNSQYYQLDNVTAINNPNLVMSGFSIFWLCTFAILLLLLIGVMIYQCCKERKIKREMGTGVIKIIKSKSQVVCVKKTWKKVLICLIIISTLMWFIFLCLLCIQQSVTSTKLSQSQTGNSSNRNPYNSLNSAVNLSFVYISNMFDVITKDSLSYLNNSVNNMSSTITNQIQAAVVEFSTSILSSFLISNIFNDATSLLNGLNIVINSMTSINSSYKILFSNISQVKGSVMVYQSAISQNLPKVCSSLSATPILQTICNNLQSTNTQFQTMVDTTEINTDSTVITLFLMQQFKVNITNITSAFQVVNSSFNSDLDNIFKSSVSTINVNSYLNFIVNLWSNSIIPLVTPIFNSASTYNNKSSPIMSNVYIYENVTIILLILIILFFIILILISFSREMIANKYWGKWANFFIHLFLIFFSIISAIVAILLLVASNYINIQICRQFNTTDGIALSDQMINAKISPAWQQIAAGLTKTVTNIQINLMQPTNILSGINTRCRNSSIGLLSVMGMGNFVNVSQVLQSGGISNTISQTQNKAWGAFVGVNPSQVIPNNLKGFLDQAQTITTYFDSVNYLPSIAQLSIPLVGIVDFVTYFHSLYTFVQSAINQLGNTIELLRLNDTAYQILQRVDSINQIQNNMNTMRLNYENLFIYRNNTQFIKQLINNLRDAAVLFSNVTYLGTVFNATFAQIISNNMLSTITQTATANISTITNQLVPCGNVSLIMEAVTTTLCSPNNLKDTLASLGLILIMVIVMCQFITILTIISALFRLKFPKNISEC